MNCIMIFRSKIIRSLTSFPSLCALYHCHHHTCYWNYCFRHAILILIIAKFRIIIAPFLLSYRILLSIPFIRLANYNVIITITILFKIPRFYQCDYLHRSCFLSHSHLHQKCSILLLFPFVLFSRRCKIMSAQHLLFLFLMIYGLGGIISQGGWRALSLRGGCFFPFADPAGGEC